MPPSFASPVDARNKFVLNSSLRLSVQKGCDPRLARVFFWTTVAGHPTLHRSCELQRVSPCRSLAARLLLRKEVIQPQVPLRLPCYDFIPITTHTLGALRPCGLEQATSGADGFHDVTGGVYKARERIHGAVADAPLLANPTS